MRSRRRRSRRTTTRSRNVWKSRVVRSQLRAPRPLRRRPRPRPRRRQQLHPRQPPTLQVHRRPRQRPRQRPHRCRQPPRPWRSLRVARRRHRPRPPSARRPARSHFQISRSPRSLARCSSGPHRWSMWRRRRRRTRGARRSRAGGQRLPRPRRPAPGDRRGRCLPSPAGGMSAQRSSTCPRWCARTLRPAERQTGQPRTPGTRSRIST